MVCTFYIRNVCIWWCCRVLRGYVMCGRIACVASGKHFRQNKGTIMSGYVQWFVPLLDVWSLLETLHDAECRYIFRTHWSCGNDWHWIDIFIHVSIMVTIIEAIDLTFIVAAAICAGSWYVYYRPMIRICVFGWYLPTRREAFNAALCIIWHV